AELKRQVGKHPTSHRYNQIPLLRSGPGGVQWELVVWDLPGAKVLLFCESANIIFQYILHFKLPRSFSKSKK
ncbi:MAG: hypothetical protein VB105_05805, partial [Paludibacter sp.]|nr:hypothetical protein [Paludibacter sp.]